MESASKNVQKDISIIEVFVINATHRVIHVKQEMFVFLVQTTYRFIMELVLKIVQKDSQKKKASAFDVQMNVKRAKQTILVLLANLDKFCIMENV